MKRVAISILCISALLHVVTAQPNSRLDYEKWLYVDFSTTGLPKINSVIVFDNTVYFDFDDGQFQSDSDWYFSDNPWSARLRQPNNWSALTNAEVLPFATSVFDEGLSQLEWEEYLGRTETLINISTQGDLIYVMNEKVLHIIDLPANLVINVDYQIGVHCALPDGKPLDGNNVPDDNILVLRCYDVLHFTAGLNELQTISDPKKIELGVLRAFDSCSRCEHENTQASSGNNSKLQVIWFEQWSEEIDSPEYIRLDQTDDFGVRKLGGIEVDDRLVRYNLATNEYQELSVKARHPMKTWLYSLEQVFSANGKWLIVVQTRDHTLIRNLSNNYKQEEKQ